ncbi:hypothetical protein CIL05_00460 [Virgibacillus profundi]|uniref:exo-alpha-sialidase n=1 Tax=Virgibacillus profundi TaxID=2024555 RepID=A0A2A2IHR1_9BACI|nr:sialidase family protein [Virgibacillus profundi]PAV31167.1 hypothetical protein CIL05_00460 [Virgibacillus profundi]PXY55350.1 exo-alpha-sialidase [Virgibacillus profundi]
MDITKHTVSRDDHIYEAFPAIVKTEKERLISVFLECNSHTDRSYTRIVYTKSDDRGRTWGKKIPLTEGTGDKDYFYDCPSITRLKDNRLVMVINKIPENEDTKQGYFHEATNELYIGDAKGDEWGEPIETPVVGIVPDTLCELESGRWLLSTHRKSKDHGCLEQMVWYTDNQGKDWTGPITLASEKGLNLCEVSILALPDQTLVAFLRENSGEGWDCYKAISKDQGETWEGLYRTPIPGCHRPVARMLQSGKIMLTYRLYAGGTTGYGTTQNLFAAWMDAGTAVETDRKKQYVRILPIDYDRSSIADNGYSGWVQFDDGELYVVQHISDEAPKCQIRGYSFTEDVFISH